MKNYICIVFLLIFFSCANIIPPSGGPKDVSPPSVLETSPSNGSIYFKDDVIKVYFDENVNIKDPRSIHTFPEPDLIEKIQSMGKAIEINLKSDLLKKTTYVIDFQGAVIDITEGNQLESFKYVFSTGGAIDSSIIYGKVTDLQYNRPIPNALVCLYAGNIQKEMDSIIKVQRPDFFSFTNKYGEYSYSNLKSGLYTLICIKDENLNFKHELNEYVSMPRGIELIDSLENNIKLFLDERHSPIEELDSIISPLNQVDSLGLIKLEYGALSLFFDSKTYTKESCLGQIIKDKKIVQNFYINDSIITFDNLEKGVYWLRLIGDLNKNKKWDLGNIKTLKNPEEIYFFTDSIQIRPNWETNLTINI